MTDDFDPRRVKAGQIREKLMGMAADADLPARGLKPDAVARAIGGKDEKVWRRLMKPVKDEAVRLAKDGKVVLLRKGKPIDPDRIKGLYSIRLLKDGEAMPVFEAEDLDDDDLDFLDDDED
ncbi:DUF3253 domain-containing protein [Oryzibacter oryziterrae]|uniref:DUF3253 domain-containing protein n=1 Tax=Oryzibacter oryziterrae TaxID=2766474 RepID=UPI001F1C7FB8|nr:DUF3253 domain-containing protein [Oryzibacter oryziterrae]